MLVVFTADYFIRWFAATTRALYPFSFNALVDFATVFPGYYTLFGPSDGAVTPSQLAFLRFVRILRILRILRSFKLVNARLTGTHICCAFVPLMDLLQHFNGKC